MVDPVTDGLPERDVGAGQYGEGLSQGRQHVIQGAIREIEQHINLSRIGTLRVFIQFGPSGPARGRDHGWMIEQEGLDTSSQRIRFAQGCSGCRDGRHHERPFLKRR